MNSTSDSCQTAGVHLCAGVIGVQDRINRWTLVRDHGRWDPELDAYEVTDPKTGELRYFVWEKPAMIFEAAALTVLIMFWVGVGSFVFLLFFGYPSGVAGDERKEQLAEVLHARYNITATWLPDLWTASQVFTIEVEQGWNEPGYLHEAPTMRACKLQPGATSQDLSLECPGPFGVMSEPQEGGADAAHDRMWRRQVADDLNITEPDGSVDEFLDDLESTVDPYEYDPYYDYEPPAPEEMYP